MSALGLSLGPGSKFILGMNEAVAALMIYGHRYTLCQDLFSMIRPKGIWIRNLVSKVP